MDRRRFLRLTAGAAAMLPAVQACSGSDDAAQTSNDGSRIIKIGFVSPLTGPGAEFGAVDTFVVEQIRQHFEREGITVAGKKYDVQILLRDNLSPSGHSPDAGSEPESESPMDLMSAAAAELISQGGVDLMLVSSGGETTIGVSNVCEANGVPCISTVVPWETWFIARGGKVGQTSFTWTYHFFWGSMDPISVYVDMWSQVNTNKVVGGLWPDDLQGNAVADPTSGYPAVLQAAGYSVVDPGRYENFSRDFSALIAAYKAGNADILTALPEPPSFAAFWRQAQQNGYEPKVATVSTRGVLFPSTIEALGDASINLSSEVWWSPRHPFTSSLTRQSAQELADAYTAATHKQWSQPIGFSHALFEVANAALTRATSLDPGSIVASLSSLKFDTVVGHLDWTNGPVKNVAETPLVGGQWQKGTRYPFELVVVSNKDHPDIPREGGMQPL
jgi:branched-chain amino acid transport system substrate-binding protein